jgi:dTDP-4-amino-4,6-dideoxygalactose transaminase
MASRDIRAGGGAAGGVRAQPALRAEFLPFHQPSIGEAEIEAVVETMRSGWLTTGPRVAELEAAFAATVGSRNAVAVNSCTAALHLALDAIGLGRGDEVIVPAMTFAATAEVVRYFDATPVLVDCDPVFLNIAADEIESKITDRTRAIIPVHFAGHPCDMDAIRDIAARHDLRVIDDAAHAFPATYRGEPVGRIADVTCFSFYATKTITTGEGGMITTDDDELAARMRMMSLHGISKDAWSRYTAAGSWYYEILEPGFKYNLTDVAAAIGLVQLGRHRELYHERLQLARMYSESLADAPALRLPTASADATHAWHLYVVQLDVDRLTIDRGAVIELLRARNIGTSVHFIPLHLHPYYRNMYGYTPESFPTAARVYERTVSLPMFPGMTGDDIWYVSESLRAIIETHLL